MKKNSKIKGLFKAAVVIAIALAFVMPGSTVFANKEQPASTIQVKSGNAAKSDWVMKVENTTGNAGETEHVIPITGSWSETIGGYNIAMYYDATKIEIVDISLEGTVADYLYTNWTAWWDDFDDTPPSYVLAVAVNFGTDVLPPGEGNLFKLVVNISEDAPEGDTDLDLANDVGPTQIDCLFARPNGDTIQPDLMDGILTIALIICGDVNNDGLVELGDIVYLINYVFRGGPAPVPCTCVGDVNNDSNVELGDIVYLINYVFRSGPEPNPDCCNPPWGCKD